jgi:hypothetical protein
MVLESLGDSRKSSAVRKVSTLKPADLMSLPMDLNTHWSSSTMAMGPASSRALTAQAGSESPDNIAPGRRLIVFVTATFTSAEFMFSSPLTKGT